MAAKRTIKAKEIVEDVRAGLTNEEILEKYQISLKSLLEIFKKLLAGQILLEMELEGRLSDTKEAETTATDAHRQAARSYVMVKLPVYDLDDLTVEGYVEDISETGLMVSGIRVEVGEKKSLLIQADEFADVYPFTFDVECRWFEPGNDAAECTAGFEIISISPVGLGELRKLCGLLGLR